VLVPAGIPNVESHGQHVLSAVGRLRAGVSPSSATRPFGGRHTGGRGEPDIRGWNANVFLLRDELVRTIRNPLLVLLAAAGSSCSSFASTSPTFC
jgi:hypothetical protein